MNRKYTSVSRTSGGRRSVPADHDQRSGDIVQAVAAFVTRYDSVRVLEYPAFVSHPQNVLERRFRASSRHQGRGCRHEGVGQFAVARRNRGPPQFRSHPAGPVCHRPASPARPTPDAWRERVLSGHCAGRPGRRLGPAAQRRAGKLLPPPVSRQPRPRSTHPMSPAPETRTAAPRHRPGPPPAAVRRHPDSSHRTSPCRRTPVPRHGQTETYGMPHHLAPARADGSARQRCNAGGVRVDAGRGVLDHRLDALPGPSRPQVRIVGGPSRGCGARLSWNRSRRAGSRRPSPRRRHRIPAIACMRSSSSLSRSPRANHPLKHLCCAGSAR